MLRSLVGSEMCIRDRAHSGMTKMYNTARQLYYWPGMKSEIQGKVNNCATCQRYLPSQPRPEIIFTPPSAALCPMHHVAMDLFDADGKKWLVMIDRYSGYAWLKQLQKTTTAKIIACISDWFLDYGWPEVIRSDGGPQFRQEFAEFCSAHSISHELSSPYNPCLLYTSPSPRDS